MIAPWKQRPDKSPPMKPLYLSHLSHAVHLHYPTVNFSFAAQDDMTLPQRFNSRDLDPFTDSIEGYDFSDNRRPHSQTAMQQIVEERDDAIGPMITGSTYQSGHVTGHVTVQYSTGVYVPPPCYQSALDGSDGGVSEGRPGGFEDEQPSTPGDHVMEKGGGGGYWLRHRH